jgi:endonuclease-3
MLHLRLPLKAAEQSFLRLKRHFVDWNEVRISSISEIKGAIGSSAKAAEELAEAIRDFLARIHRDRFQTSLEFLNELTIAQARKYLRSLGAITTATIDLILRLKKSQAVVPLDKNSERVLVRIGLVPSRYTLRQKQRFLQRLVPEDQVVSFHRSVVDLARRVCRQDEDAVKCKECPMRQGCSFRRRVSRVSRRNGGRARKRRSS